jgi:predicted RNA methylase
MNDSFIVTDIGAGTGQLARMFAGRCSKLHAVEPDPAMRQVAQVSLAGFPTVEIVA